MLACNKEGMKRQSLKTIIKTCKGKTFNYKPLLSMAKDTKTKKGLSYGYLTGILYLSPSSEGRQEGLNIPNTCPFATIGCKKACLYTAGRGAFFSIKKARLHKTLFLLEGKTFNALPHQEGLLSLKYDIESLKTKAHNKGLIPCIRLNGTSDLKCHTWGLMEDFNNIQFYDYTKDFSRMKLYMQGLLPSNYHLTFSYNEDNKKACQEVLKQGHNVAVCFKGALPNFFMGYKVINGDLHDMTFIHKAKKGLIIGLIAKGKAKKDIEGFTIDNRQGLKSIL